MHTTNYFNTLIEVAEDCPVDIAEAPPQKAEPTTAAITFEILANNPYKYTSDDLIFTVYAMKNALPAIEIDTARERFFSKGQPCLRSSPLCKRYGWGVHCNREGRIALHAVESETYRQLTAEQSVKKLKAMRSKCKLFNFQS